MVTSRYFLQPVEELAKKHSVRAWPLANDFRQELAMLKELRPGSCVGLVSISPGILRAAEVPLLRGNELLLMTATPDVGSRLLALLRASSHVLCDRPSLPLVEQSLRQNRSQLMRMPQVHCAELLSAPIRSTFSARRLACRHRPPPADPPAMFNHIRADLAIIRERDPAARGWLEIICCYPGFQAISLHRISHRLDQPPAAEISRSLPQPVGRGLTGIEIHPGARIGHSVFIDHGMGVVIGETAEIGPRCLLTKESPWAARARSTANATPPWRKTWWWGPAPRCWARSQLAPTPASAGSVVVRDVESDCTVVGIPGRVVPSGVRINPLAHSALPDAEANVIRNLMERIDALENQNQALIALMKGISPDFQAINPERGESQNLQDKEIIEFLGCEP